MLSNHYDALMSIGLLGHSYKKKPVDFKSFFLADIFVD